MSIAVLVGANAVGHLVAGSEMPRHRRHGLITLALTACMMAGARPIQGQLPAATDAKQFVGTWRLVSDTQVGLMIYDAGGNMAAQVMPMRPRPPYAGTQPTPEEAKAAIAGYLAYFGTYTVDEQAHTVTHHRLASLNPGQTGEDAVRRYRFAGNRLILVAVESGNQITWERAK